MNASLELSFIRTAWVVASVAIWSYWGWQAVVGASLVLAVVILINVSFFLERLLKRVDGLAEELEEQVQTQVQVNGPALHPLGRDLDQSPLAFK